MSDPEKTGDPAEPSRRYWKAAISCLATAEKRDAAWEFYLKQLADTGVDTMSALVLLMEANGAFLLTLPEKFQQELIRPVTDRLSALRGEMAAHWERQQNMLAALDAVRKSVDSAAGSIQQNDRSITLKVQAAIKDIDVTSLTRDINHTLKTDTLQPIQN